jgi:hypothetical protein
MPIFLSRYNSSAWFEIVDKITSRIRSWGGQWLNPAGKTVLIKSVLSSLSIFQCSGLLAPKSILEKIGKSLRSFLWAGGKTNTKKFHLINWKQVCQPYNKGGLAIKDPTIMNISMGAKLAWRLVTGNSDWWKKALVEKYFQSPRLRCLEEPLPATPGSPIWRLLKNTTSLIQAKLSWAPGNGETINIWMDRILNHEPLKSLEILHPLKNWCYMNDLTKLQDFCLWNNEGDWVRWKPPNLPENLTPLLPILFNNLAGCAPLNRFTADSRSWGGKPFSVKEGYSHLLSNLPGFPTSKLWKEIWSGPSLPKVNAFCWLLAHGKILTAENLLKRGIQGPSRCPLCLEASETITHLFLECNFSLQLWSLIYLPLPNISPLPDSWTTLLTHWKQRYSGSFKNKKGFTLLWKQIPKFVTWEIWLARNQAIFHGKSPSVNSSFAKICGITSEVFRNKATDLDPPGILDSSEEGWVNYI